MADLISRQAAIDAIEEMQIPIMRSEFSDEQLIFTGMPEALAEIKRLPSAQPNKEQKKTGEWEMFELRRMVMDDLIDKQAAIDALDQIFDRCEEIEAHLPEGNPDRTGYKMYPDYMTVWKYLHQLPSAQPEQRWIPCSERLPEYGQAVLVALDGGSMTDGVRSSDHAGRSVWDCALDNRTWYDDENIVIAWMPLPEPWRGEEDGV